MCVWCGVFARAERASYSSFRTEYTSRIMLPTGDELAAQRTAPLLNSQQQTISNGNGAQYSFSSNGSGAQHSFSSGSGSSSYDPNQMPPTMQPGEGNEPPSAQQMLRCVAVVSIVTLGTSFQFGFGTASLNNLEHLMNSDDSLLGSKHPLTLALWSLIVAGFGVGGLLSSCVVSHVMFLLSRRAALFTCSFLALVSFALLLLGKSWFALFAGRVLIGMVAGLGTAVVPLYFQELAPEHWRATFLTAHQLGIGLGCVAALSLTTPAVLGTSALWRLTYLAPLAGALVQACVLPFLPESPHYVYQTFGSSEALNCLYLLESRGSALSKLATMRGEAAEAAHSHHPGGGGGLAPLTLSELLSSQVLRRQLAIGTALLLSMQLCGIDALLFYSTRVLSSSGCSSPEAASTLLGVAYLLGTPLSMLCAGRFGRKPLLLAAWAGISLCYAVSTACLLCLRPRSDEVGGDGAAAFGDDAAGIGNALGLTHNQLQTAAVGALAGVIGFFSIGPGSAGWFVVAEIFPSHARDAAMTLGVSLNWVGNIAVAITFPALHAGMGPYVFGLFAVVSFGFGLLTHRYLPETKGRSIDDVTNVIEAAQW